MRALEITLFAFSLAGIALVFGAEFLRARGPRSVTLSGPMLTVFRIFLGIVFTVLGVIGSLLPILQGWIFFLLAALVLFPRSNFAVKALDKAEAKMPRMVAALRRVGIGRHHDPESPRDLG